MADISLESLINGGVLPGTHPGLDQFTILAAGDQILETGMNYMLAAGGSYTLPATILPGQSVRVLARVDGTRIISNGNHIEQIGEGADLLLDAGHYVQLVAVNANLVSIVLLGTAPNADDLADGREAFEILEHPGVMEVGGRYLITAPGTYSLPPFMPRGRSVRVLALADPVYISRNGLTVPALGQSNEMSLSHGQHVDFIASADDVVQLGYISMSQLPSEGGGGDNGGTAAQQWVNVGNAHLIDGLTNSFVMVGSEGGFVTLSPEIPMFASFSVRAKGGPVTIEVNDFQVGSLPAGTDLTINSGEIRNFYRYSETAIEIL